MTMRDTSDYDSDRERLWKTAVETLTAATRLEHPKYGEIDFADFLADVLRSVAANLGDPHLITAGRPGSWESATLNDLVLGTVGTDPSMIELAAYRTEPVSIPLNVAMLVFIDKDQPDAPLEHDEAVEAAGGDDVLSAKITQKYIDAYRDYAERFTAAVHSEAAEHHIPAGLVTVVTDTHPDAHPGQAIDNPIEGDVDDLVWHLWSTAREAVGLPTVPKGREI